MAETLRDQSTNTLKENVAILMDRVERILRNVEGTDGHRGLVMQSQDNTRDIEELKKDIVKTDTAIRKDFSYLTAAIKEDLNSHIAEHAARKKELNDFLVKVWGAVISGVILTVLLNIIFP